MTVSIGNPITDVWDFRCCLIEEGYCPECLALLIDGEPLCPKCEHDVLKEVQDDQERWAC